MANQATGARATRRETNGRGPTRAARAVATLLAAIWMMLSAQAALAQTTTCTVVFGPGGTSSRTMTTLRVQPGVETQIAVTANDDATFSPSLACGAPASSYTARPRITRSDSSVVTTGSDFTFTYNNGAKIRRASGAYYFTASAQQSGQTVSTSGVGIVTAITTPGTVAEGTSGTFELYAGGATTVAATNPPGGLIALQVQVQGPPPSISGISPNRGPLGGGNSITITGQNFGASGSTVTIGGNPASITAQSSGSITVTVPSGTAGGASLTVTTADGQTVSTIYTYVAAPAVTALAPTSGPAGGGNSVTVTGTGFAFNAASDVSQVFFGATAATGFTVNSNTQITATAPAGSGTVNVRVTASGGTSPTGPGNLYTYVAAPVFTLTLSGSPNPATANSNVTFSATLSTSTATVAGNQVVVDFTIPAGATFVSASGTGWTCAQQAPGARCTRPQVAQGSAPVITLVVQAGTASPLTVNASASGGGTAAAAAVTASVTVNPATTAAPVVNVPANGVVTAFATPTYAGTAPANSTVTVYVDGAAIGTATANTSGNWSLTQPTALGQGAHTVRATAQSSGASVSPNSNTNTFTVDTVPPPAPVIVSPANGSTTTDPFVEINGTAEANSTISLSVNGNQPQTTIADVAGNWSFGGPYFGPGTRTASVTARDAAGNVSPTATSTFTVAEAPQVLSEPSDRTVAENEGVSFDAFADGTPPPTVQWQVSTNGGSSFSDIPGETSTGLFVVARAADNGSQYRAVFTNSAGSATTRAATLTVVRAPTANAQSVTAAFNTATQITLTANDPNNPPRAVTAYTVTTQPSHGTLSGTAPNLTYTPTSGYTGPDSFEFTAGNGVATSSPATVGITVAAPAPVVSTVSPAIGTAVGGTSVTISGSGFTGATAVSFGGTAATGFTVVNDTTITATTAARAPGAVAVAVTTPQGTGTSAAGAFIYTAPAITLAPASLPNGTVGIAYSQTLVASGGAGTYTYAVTAGALPAGMTLASNGQLSGTPTAGGTFNFNVTATDGSTPANGGPFSGARAYSFTVNAPTIVVQPTMLAGATRGAAYSRTLTASGGTAPYTFTVSAGTLPPGLTLETATGTLTGTPTAPGSYTFTVLATDSSTGTGAPYGGTRSYTLTVAAPPIAITPATLPGGAAETPYTQALTASGGTGPYTYAVTSGTLPAGLTLSSAGVLSGTPTDEGTASFTVTASDASTPAQTGSQAYTLAIAARVGGATRTWVAPDGLDTASCSRANPCATFAAAFARTAAGGEINCVDNGAYGTLTITRAVTIMCGDKLGRAGVIVSGSDAIVVAAGANDRVVLSGLDIEGLGNAAVAAGTYGVRFTSGGSLLIRNATIRGTRGYAVAFEPDVSAGLTLIDVAITDSGAAGTVDSGGVLVRPAAGTARLTASGLRVTGGQQAGVRLDAAALGSQIAATIVRSVVSDNAGTGVASTGTGGTVRTTIVGSTVVGNAVGVSTAGAGSTSVIGDSTVSRNAVGLATTLGANTATAGGNTLAGNAAAGGFTQSVGNQ